MLYDYYCKFRHNTDLLNFFVYVLKVVTQYSYFNNKKFPQSFTAKKLVDTQPISLPYQPLP